jgi:hypothetical protein
MHFSQLPENLKNVFVAKVTEQSLLTREGKAKLRKLIDDLSRIAAARREPADGPPDQDRGDQALAGEP